MFEDVIEKLCTNMEYSIITEIEMLRNLARLRIGWDLYGDEFIINIRKDSENKFYIYHEFPLWDKLDTNIIKEYVNKRGLYSYYEDSMNWIACKGLDDSEQLFYALIEMVKICTQVEAIIVEKGY